MQEWWALLGSPGSRPGPSVVRIYLGDQKASRE